MKLAFGFGLSVSRDEVTKHEPNREVELQIDVQNPIFGNHHALARENTTDAIRALGVLTEKVQPRDNVHWGEPCSLVERVTLNLVVVDVELLVWVTCCEVEYEVVTEGVNVVVVDRVVELGEFGFCES